LGTGALASITTGTEDSALGFHALFLSTTGVENTTTGSSALINNSTGKENTATGADALAGNTTGATGNENTATGGDALLNNSMGNDNTATGEGALQFNTTGSNNTAVGWGAGFNLTTGSNDIDIGNAAVAAESNTIRIGSKGTQTRAFIAGIVNSPIFGSPVVVGAAGRLGIQASSARFKRDIHDMGNASGKLMKLRPVTFRYKEDPAGALQYGLIAEEVARVYPELVTYGADGKVEAVAYHLLPAMLLNEMQKQARDNQAKGRADRSATTADRCAAEADQHFAKGDGPDRYADRAPERSRGAGPQGEPRTPGSRDALVRTSSGTWELKFSPSVGASCVDGWVCAL
jgi:hypothetical protein